MANKSSKIEPAEHGKLCESSNDTTSKLPEPILHHILSLLPIKQAARTSVLSKQWQFLWTWVPDLTLLARELHSKVMSFDQIVLKIFLSRRSQCIRKFNLGVSSEHCDQIKLHSIMCPVLERGVEELNFCMEAESHELLELPPGLFSCKNLVVLRLKGVAMSFSSSVDFPNLKILHLRKVKYKDEATFRDLISGCRVFDYLMVALGGSVPDNDFHYEISSVTVKQIHLLEMAVGYYRPSKVTVTAPALEHFIIYYGAAPCVLVFGNVPNSVHSEFYMFPLSESKKSHAGTTKGILSTLCRVQFLKLEFDLFHAYEHHIPISNFPRFENLVELEFIGVCCWPLLLNMLQSSPRLENLTFVSNWFRYDACEEPLSWISPRDVPYCLVFTLTTIKFNYFEGLKAEVDFIRYVLNNSKVLRKMTITCSPGAKVKRRVGAALQKICEFQRSSEECVLSFEENKLEKFNLFLCAFFNKVRVCL